MLMFGYSFLSNLLEYLILMLLILMLTIAVLLILVLLILMMIIVFKLLSKEILLYFIDLKFVVYIDIKFRILRKVDEKSIFNDKYFLNIRIKFMLELRDEVFVRSVEFRRIL